jgi:hypothetical protein
MNKNQLSRQPDNLGSACAQHDISDGARRRYPVRRASVHVSSFYVDFVQASAASTSSKQLDSGDLPDCSNNSEKNIRPLARLLDNHKKKYFYDFIVNTAYVIYIDA